MSLKAILDRIQADAERQVEAIRLQAEREAEEILEEGQQQARRDHESAYRQALGPLDGERARILNQAKFDVLCLTGRAREALAEEILAKVRQQLRNIRGSKLYPDALAKILGEILPQLGDTHSLEETLILQADPRDQALLESMLLERAVQVRVEYTLYCWGGLNARSPDGNIQLVNTLESRYERIMPYLTRQLISWLETEGQRQETEDVRV